MSHRQQDASPQIERETVIAASPEEVWQFVTGSGWLAAEVRLELVPGGEAMFRDGATFKTGWIEEARPPEDERAPGRLVFWWAADGESASRVELELIPMADATRVRVAESRPLEVLDLIGIPLPGSGGSPGGPVLVAA